MKERRQSTYSKAEREAEREGGREGGRQRVREAGRERVREGGRERGREGTEVATDRCITHRTDAYPHSESSQITLSKRGEVLQPVVCIGKPKDMATVKPV